MSGTATPTVKVLIAENNPVIRLGLRASLTEHPALVVVGGDEEAGHAHALVAQVREHRPRVVLLGGPPPLGERVAALHNADLGTRVIVLSTGVNPRSLVRVLAAGAHGCLLYGHFEPGELVDVVRAVAEGEACVSPPVMTALVRGLHDGELTVSGERALLLTPREAEIMDLVAAGLSNRQIAERLVIAEKTVKNHIHQIYKRLGVYDRDHAIFRWNELHGT
ncbi:LuxR C-terminal-related transcriptional regulator [Spirillospora sp. NPDC048911]|uniref:LuxR C-terminal-related transcriptional regulator n=1 Tax=Spirillospora sp. NPDC048911 TaxID=3364527 RepID=UPI00371D9128